MAIYNIHFISIYGPMIRPVF